MEHIFPGVGAWCYSLRGFSRGAKPRRRGRRRRHQLKGSRSSALELFFSNTSTACRRPVAELNGCRAAAPSLFVVLPAKGVLPPGHDADAEVF